MQAGAGASSCEAKPQETPYTEAIEKGHTLTDIAETMSLGEIIMEAAEGALGHGIHQWNK
ncbi:hypothetical protein AV540_13075 [Brevibacillus parabrevis]|uniref:hypothetical protein n=1 Tax=Brevibacillus parabrevis TaxID=54914 RepID=UPI0007ABDFBA|nr:hypothetical protein [Brevibacillus parabrevis]KZE50379.1 hypothetical protein AV540_13075 [Brevibacillus parabrevis]